MRFHVNGNDVTDKRDTAAKWVQLAAIALSVFLTMALWFSTSSVGRQLQTSWKLTDGQLAWLTVSVQVGFVFGTLISAMLNLPDRLRADRLLALSAFAGAIANGLIPYLAAGDQNLNAFPSVIALRFVTGMTLAGVYPPGMKLMASWFSRNRGLAIGILVGALTLGSALPHLLMAFPSFGTASGGHLAWQDMMYTVSASAVLAGVISLLYIRPGPHVSQGSRFNWRYIFTAWKNVPLRRANYGYLGHQWELYAMWTWVPPMLHESFLEAGHTPAAGRLAGFSVIAIGCVSCIVAGWWADRAGRTLIAIISLAVSGMCCLLAGHLGGSPYVLLAICLVWGALVISDSAQYSASITELCDPDLVGTALTIQTCAGFLLTTVTIGFLPMIQASTGNGMAFSLLAIGPAFGIWQMFRLRRMPEAVRMSGGNR